MLRAFIVPPSISMSTLTYGDCHYAAVAAAGGDEVLVDAITEALSPVLSRIWPAGTSFDIEIHSDMPAMPAAVPELVDTEIAVDTGLTACNSDEPTPANLHQALEDTYQAYADKIHRQYKNWPVHQFIAVAKNNCAPSERLIPMAH